MTRATSTLLARCTAASFALNAALHSLGYTKVTGMAGDNADLRSLLAVLWLCFSAGLLSLALIALVLATSPVPQRRSVFLYAAIFPLATAVLMLVFMGFIFPVALLAVTAGLAIATALTSPDSQAVPHV